MDLPGYEWNVLRCTELLRTDLSVGTKTEGCQVGSYFEIQGDVFKLILDYLFRKRGKSVLSVVQSEIKIQVKQYGYDKFKDFIGGVPGVELTQEGSVIFAQLNDDFMRRGPSAWADIANHAMQIIAVKGGSTALTIKKKQTVGVCFHFKRKGFCRKGRRCPFRHETPDGTIVQEPQKKWTNRPALSYSRRKDLERIRMNGEALFAQLRTCNPAARREDYHNGTRWNLDTLADDLRLLNLKTSQILRSVAAGQRKVTEDW